MLGFFVDMLFGTLYLIPLAIAWAINKHEIKLGLKAFFSENQDLEQFGPIVRRVRDEEAKLDAEKPAIPVSRARSARITFLLWFVLVYVTRLPIIVLHFSLISRYPRSYSPAWRATTLGMWDLMILALCFWTSGAAAPRNPESDGVPHISAIVFSFLVLTMNVYDCCAIFLPQIGGIPLIRKPAHRFSIYGLVVQGFLIVISFACIYFALSRLDGWVFGDKEEEKRLTPVEAVYFSMVTAATVGYGDISPKKPAGMLLVILEIAIGWGYTVLAVTSVVAVKITKHLKVYEDQVQEEAAKRQTEQGAP